MQAVTVTYGFSAKIVRHIRRTDSRYFENLYYDFFSTRLIPLERIVKLSTNLNLYLFHLLVNQSLHRSECIRYFVRISRPSVMI